MARSIVVIDLDGTLCDASKRLHHIQKTPKDWDSFFSEMHLDEPNRWCLELIEVLRNRHRILFLTGRNEQYREKTLAWLSRHVPGFTMHDLNLALLMRPVGDRRTDVEWKTDAYLHIIKPIGEVLFAVDDRCRIVRMWRSLGVPCLACDDWETREGGAQVVEEIHQHFLGKAAEQ
jgi:hypothetical protein